MLENGVGNSLSLLMCIMKDLELRPSGIQPLKSGKSYNYFPRLQFISQRVLRPEVVPGVIGMLILSWHPVRAVHQTHGTRYFLFADLAATGCASNHTYGCDFICMKPPHMAVTWYVSNHPCGNNITCIKTSYIAVSSCACNHLHDSEFTCIKLLKWQGLHKNVSPQL